MIKFSNRVIILEGPDGAGKTSLAEHLRDKYGFIYQHEGPPPPNVDLLTYYGSKLYDACIAEQPVVFDRFHVGQAIYGPLLRDDHTFGLSQLYIMRRMIEAYGITVVFCIPPYEDAHKNWKGRKGELYANSETYNRVYERFVTLSSHPVFSTGTHWNYRAVEKGLACEVLMKLSRAANILPLGVLGSPTGRFLFVGEIANQEALDLPFFSTIDSSAYLTRVIAEAGYNEDEVAFVNMINLARHTNDDLLKYLSSKFKSIIAMGNVARSHLEVLGILHNYVDHPQYRRRFHASLTHEYVAQLRDIRRTFYATTA